jgi:hypothetical protein
MICSKIRNRWDGPFKTAKEIDRRRNLDCRYYEGCLDKAAKANARDIECETCEFKNDKTYTMTQKDYVGLLSLYYTIFDGLSVEMEAGNGEFLNDADMPTTCRFEEF